MMWQPPKIETEVMTPIGLCHCRVYRTKWEDQFEVEFWQFAPHGQLDNSFTSFSAGVYMRKTGDSYTIIRNRPNYKANELWLELVKVME